MMTQIHHLHKIVNILPGFFVPIWKFRKSPLEIITFFRANPPKMTKIGQEGAEVGLTMLESKKTVIASEAKQSHHFQAIESIFHFVGLLRRSSPRNDRSRDFLRINQRRGP